MEVLKGDFYCYECSVQFDKKHVFDIHLSDVHEEQLDKKQGNDSQILFIPKAKELEIKHPEENSLKNKSKRTKVLKKAVSGHEGKEKIKCQICDTMFEQMGYLNKHMVTVHDGKKPFQCDICNFEFRQKGQK